MRTVRTCCAATPARGRSAAQADSRHRLLSAYCNSLLRRGKGSAIRGNAACAGELRARMDRSPKDAKRPDGGFGVDGGGRSPALGGLPLGESPVGGIFMKLVL